MTDGKSKTIWYVISHLGTGGTERHISTLIPLQLAQGYRIRLVIYGQNQGKSYHSFPDDVEITYLGDVYGMSQKKRLLGLRQLVQQHKPDIVSSWIADVNVRTLLALLGIKTRIIVSEVSHPIKQPLSFISRVLRLLLYPTAGAIVVQTKQVKWFYPFWLWRKIRIINNPINIYPDKGPQANRIVIAAGRLSEEKRFDILIEAFAQIVKDFPNWQLMIWGEGPERRKLEQMVRDYKLLGVIDLPGNSTAPADWLNTGQVFAMCSEYEGFPNALGEAMGAGYPVVVTPFNFGPRDMIVPGTDGWIAHGCLTQDLAEALAKIMADESLARTMGHNAKEKTARLWNKEKIAQEWMTLLT